MLIKLIWWSVNLVCYLLVRNWFLCNEFCFLLTLFWFFEVVCYFISLFMYWYSFYFSLFFKPWICLWNWMMWSIFAAIHEKSKMSTVPCLSIACGISCVCIICALAVPDGITTRIGCGVSVLWLKLKRKRQIFIEIR